MTINIVSTYDSGVTFVIGKDDELIVTSGGSIVNDDSYAIGGFSHSTLMVQGAVIGGTGFLDDGGDDSIAVGIGGSILGLNGNAIYIGGSDDFISNLGEIADAEKTAIAVGNESTLSNSGTITSGGGHAFAGGADEDINNTGVISSFGSSSTIYGSGLNANLTNSGTITASVLANNVIEFKAQSSVITNIGTISGGIDGITLDKSEDYISNSGTISGFESAIIVLGIEGYNTLVNSGLIESSEFLETAIEFLTSGDDTINNSGKILGGVLFGGEDSGLTNSGTITGDVDFAATGDSLYNSGAINGSILFEQSPGTFLNSGTISEGVTFQQVEGLATNSGTIGGDIVFDQAGAALDNSGHILHDVGFVGTGSNFTNTGVVGGNVVFTGNYNYFDGAFGETLGLVEGAGQSGTYLGGGNGVHFQFVCSDLSSGDTITGGASANDYLNILNNGSVTAHDLKHVSGLESIHLSGAIQIAITEQIADTADGGLTLGGSGNDTFDLSRVINKADQVEIRGGEDDVIIAGASRDTFIYSTVGGSTGADYNKISGVNFAHDFFDVSDASGGDILKLKAGITTGALSSGGGFDAGLTSDIGTHLGAHDAILFTASSGTLSGHTFLVVDCNATAGYQANQDLVIDVTGAKGTLTLANFT